MKNRHFPSLFLLTTLLFVSSVPTAAALNSKKVRAVLDGEILKSVRLYNFSRNDYFSVRDIAEVYGSHLVWHPVTGKVALSFNNRRLDIYIKSTKVFFGDKKKRMSLPTRSVSGDVLIPAAFILSKDFANFSETSSSWNRDAGILTIERKVNVSQPRFYARPASSQIKIELQEDLPYTFSRKDPNKVVISFQRGRLSEGTMEIDDGGIKNIELKNKAREAVVTITLADKSLNVDRKLLRDPARLVLTIISTPERAPIEAVVSSSGTASEVAVSSAAEAATAAPVEEAAEQATAPVVPAVTEKEPQRKKLIVLDAGHGGEDPGAIGHNGTKEKDINLAIVMELKRLFDNDEDREYDVVLTRTNDTFIPLVERTSIANEKKADLFVSIHCNANPGKNSSGFEIYFLSEKASDDEAAATATMENAVVQLEGKPSKKRARLQELLWSLMVNEFINESSELCSFVTGEVGRRIKILNRGVKQAGFFVLRGTEMPAVLVECAFLSNYAEEAKLRTKKFQCQIADAVFEGVKKYGLRKNDLLNVRR